MFNDWKTGVDTPCRRGCQGGMSGVWKAAENGTLFLSKFSVFGKGWKAALGLRLEVGFCRAVCATERKMPKPDNKTSRVALFFGVDKFSIYN